MNHRILTKSNLQHLTKTQLAEMYNDAVETIWFKDVRLKELHEENEALWKAYEDVSDKLYG